MKSGSIGSVLAIMLVIVAWTAHFTGAAGTNIAMGPPRIVAAEDSTTPYQLRAQTIAACKVGRRGYCFKYQGVCENRAVGEKNCSAWFSACMQCHDAADGCSSEATKVGAQCTKCSTAWSACMQRSYRQHWPEPHRYKEG